MVATIEGIDIYLHEAIWVLHTRAPIPANKLILHKNGDTMNNLIENLELIDDEDDTRPKVFHQDQYINYKEYIRVNFTDIFEILFEQQ